MTLTLSELGIIIARFEATAGIPFHRIMHKSSRRNLRDSFYKHNQSLEVDGEVSSKKVANLTLALQNHVVDIKVCEHFKDVYCKPYVTS